MSNIFLQEVLKKDEFSNKVIPVKSAWKAPRNLIFARKNKKNRFFLLKRLQIQKIVVPLHPQSRTKAT